MFKGKSFYNLSEGKILNSFQSLLDNLEKLTYSSYICELIDICTEDEEENKWLFRELITCLYLLNTDALDYELLIRAFELKLLRATGYGIIFENCCLCKKRIPVSNYISLSHYGGVCDECVKEHGIYVSKATYNTLKFLNTVSMDKVYRVNVSKEVKEEIARVTSSIINNNYSRKPKSLEMLNYIKE